MKFYTKMEGKRNSGIRACSYCVADRNKLNNLIVFEYCSKLQWD